jgi:hypothetical protein
VDKKSLETKEKEFQGGNFLVKSIEKLSEENKKMIISHFFGGVVQV